MSWLDAARREVDRLPRAYWILWVGSLINRAGAFVVPFLAIYVGQLRGHGVEIAGGVMALYGAGNLFAGGVGGTLADRIGRKPTLLFSLLGGAIALSALGVAESVPALSAAAFAVGFVGEMYRPAVSAMVADLVEGPARELAFARMYWCVNLGFALAPLLAGLALRSSYAWLFAVDAITMLLYAAVVWRLPESRPAAARAATASSGGALLGDRVFLAFLLLAGGTSLVMWQSGSTLPLDMTAHGVSPARYGAVMALNGACIVLLQPWLSRVVARRSRTLVLAAAALAMGVGFGLYAVVHSTPGYVVAVVVWTVGEIALVPTGSVVVAELAPASYRGRYQGAYSMMWGLGALAGPLGGSLLLSRFGGGALWGTAFFTMVVVALGHLSLGPARAAREKATRQDGR